MTKQFIAQVCVSKSLDLKKGVKIPLGNLLPYAVGTWTIPEEKAKHIIRLEVYNKGEFMGAFTVKGYSVGQRQDAVINQGINFDLSPIFGSTSGTFPYDNFRKAWILYEIETVYSVNNK